MVPLPPEPLLILPGLLCGRAMFEETLAAFPASVIIDDFYPDATSIEAMARVALDRAPRQFCLLGHSMGARIALEILRLAPQRVSRLAIADTGIHTVQPGERRKREALSKLGHNSGFETLVDTWLPPMIGPRYRDESALIMRLKSMCLSAGQEVYDRQISALLSRPDPSAVLSNICCPVFVIVGADDEWSPVEQHQDIARRIEGAQLRIVPDAGHMLPAEDPQKFIAILREWMAEDTSKI